MRVEGAATSAHEFNTLRDIATMGVLGDIVLGFALTGLASMGEEIDRHLPGAAFTPGCLEGLPPHRCAALGRKFPRWIETLKKHPPEVITFNIVKNMQVAMQFDRRARVASLMALLNWLISEELAADPQATVDAFDAAPRAPGG